MATPAQITANRLNAQLTTGPRTPEGKARSSRNATKLGLFTMHELVRPDQEAEYQQISAALWKALAPEDVLQEALAVEIVRATWRLQRCAEVESTLLDSVLETGLDPMQNETAIRIQNAVDRARGQSNSIIRRATAELRRLQTDRQIARETLPGKDLSTLGVVAMQQVWTTLHKQIKTKDLAARTHAESAWGGNMSDIVLQVRKAAAQFTAQDATKRNQSAAVL